MLQMFLCPSTVSRACQRADKLNSLSDIIKEVTHQNYHLVVELPQCSFLWKQSCVCSVNQKVEMEQILQHTPAALTCEMNEISIMTSEEK